MGSALTRLLTIIIGVTGTAVSAYFIVVAMSMSSSIPPVSASGEGEHAAAAEHGEGGHGGEHGAAAEHGGGEHGGGEHAAAGGEHGGGEHGGGEHGGGEHGEGAPAAPKAPEEIDKNTGLVLRHWMALDQIFVNLVGPGNEGHSVTFQVDIELFDDLKKDWLEARIAALKSAALEVSRTQSYADLKTLSGKLYFKEALVTGMNEAIRAPIVRDIHLTAIYVK